MLTTTLDDLRASLSEEAYARVTQCIGGPERWGSGPIPLSALLKPWRSHEGFVRLSDLLERSEVLRILAALGHSSLVHEWLCDCIERAANVVGDRAASVMDIVRSVRDSGGSEPRIECLATLDLMIAADRLMAWDHEAAISHALHAVYAITGGTRSAHRCAEWCDARLAAYLDEEVGR
jgi:hypothetical protein